jgi:hypothetical protein
MSPVPRFPALALLLACAPPNAPESSREPCRGTSFDADAPPQTCLVQSVSPPPAPSPRALKLRVLEEATIRSGHEATFTLPDATSTDALARDSVTLPS